MWNPDFYTLPGFSDFEVLSLCLTYIPAVHVNRPRNYVTSECYLRNANTSRQRKQPTCSYKHIQVTVQINILVQAHKDNCTANILVQTNKDKDTASCPHKRTQGQANMFTSNNEQDTLTLPPAGSWDTSISHIYTIICTIYCSCLITVRLSPYCTDSIMITLRTHTSPQYFIQITRSQHNIHVCIGHKHINQPHTHRGSGFTGHGIHACLHSHVLLRSFEVLFVF